MRISCIEDIIIPKDYCADKIHMKMSYILSTCIARFYEALTILHLVSLCVSACLLTIISIVKISAKTLTYRNVLLLPPSHCHQPLFCVRVEVTLVVLLKVQHIFYLPINFLFLLYSSKVSSTLRS